MFSDQLNYVNECDKILASLCERVGTDKKSLHKRVSEVFDQRLEVERLFLEVIKSFSFSINQIPMPISEVFKEKVLHFFREYQEKSEHFKKAINEIFNRGSNRGIVCDHVMDVIDQLIDLANDELDKTLKERFAREITEIEEQRQSEKEELKNKGKKAEMLVEKMRSQLTSAQEEFNNRENDHVKEVEVTKNKGLNYENKISEMSRLQNELVKWIQGKPVDRNLIHSQIPNLNLAPS